MSVVEGFAGMRVRNGQLVFQPFLPKNWNAFSFSIGFRGVQLKVSITADQISIRNNSDQELQIVVFNQAYPVPHGEKVISYKGALA
jgi:maltose phosphorylase